jgi:hypothetical protein
MGLKSQSLTGLFFLGHSNIRGIQPSEINVIDIEIMAQEVKI